MNTRSRAGLSRELLLAYALPAFVVAFPTIPVFIVLPDLYGVQLGLGLASTGLAMLLARGFDTLTDPVIGALSDRFAFRGNRRKPWIATGAVIAGLGLFQILNPPPDVSLIYLFSWSVVLYSGWSMIAVPYTAWGAELSADYDERTRITSWREGFMLLGIIGAGALNAGTGQLGWEPVESTGAIAWAAIILGSLVVPLLIWRVPESRPIRKTTTDMGQWRRGISQLLSNKPFLRLLAAWFVNGLANGIPAALFFIYLEHGLGARDEERPLFVLGYFVSAIAAIPFWQRISRRIGKHRAWCWAMLSACIAFAAVPAIPAGGLAAFALICVVTGVALGADLALPPAIQADVVDYDELRTGQARAGLQFALWSMSTKLALALAVGLALSGVEAGGFDPADVSERGRFALLVIYALVPVVIKALAICLVWNYPLTARRHAIVRRRLSRRRRA